MSCHSSFLMNVKNSVMICQYNVPEWIHDEQMQLWINYANSSNKLCKCPHEWCREELQEAQWDAAKANLVPCRTCGRRFNPDRVGVHERICKAKPREATDLDLENRPPPPPYPGTGSSSNTDPKANGGMNRNKTFTGDPPKSFNSTSVIIISIHWRVFRRF